MQVQQVKYRTPKQVMELWIKSLRSGEYKQTRNVLKCESGGFCCLGVLCDLAAKDGGASWSKDSWGNWAFNEFYSGSPPDEIVEYLGITEVEVQTLMQMNDDEGKSFRKIADHIEQELLPKVPK